MGSKSHKKKKKAHRQTKFVSSLSNQSSAVPNPVGILPENAEKTGNLRVSPSPSLPAEVNLSPYLEKEGEEAATLRNQAPSKSPSSSPNRDAETAPSSSQSPSKVPPSVTDPTPNHQNVPRSFANAVRADPTRNQGSDNTNPPSVGSYTTINGVRTVVFTAAEDEKLAEPFKLSLVGKFSFGRPQIPLIQKALDGLGCVPAKVQLLNLRHVLISMGSPEDYSKLWLRREIFIDGSPMRIFKWTPDFDAKHESSIVPVWVRFTGLPPHLLNQQALFAIGNLIGSTIKMDEATKNRTRLLYARLCIEIDLKTKPPEEVSVMRNGQLLHIPVIYERLPEFCSHCMHLGHNEGQCYIKTNGPRPRRNLEKKPKKDQGIHVDPKHRDKSPHERCSPPAVSIPVDRNPLGEGTSGLKGSDVAKVPQKLEDCNPFQALVPFNDLEDVHDEESGSEEESMNSESVSDDESPESDDVSDESNDHNSGPVFSSPRKHLMEQLPSPKASSSIKPMIKSSSSPDLAKRPYQLSGKLQADSSLQHAMVRNTRSRTRQDSGFPIPNSTGGTTKSARIRH